MSVRKSWKMLHLLNTLKAGKSGLTTNELNEAGVDCEPDGIMPLGAAVSLNDDTYSLHPAATAILNRCVVGCRCWSEADMLVDRPEIFVIMPFGESWSTIVFEKVIKETINAANFKCTRGDDPIRVGALTETVWNAILRAGLVIADVSAINPNVFYEIGLTHGIGKDCFIIKQRDAEIPADFGGTHYYEYDLLNLKKLRDTLEFEINEWAKKNKIDGVRKLLPFSADS